MVTPGTPGSPGSSPEMFTMTQQRTCPSCGAPLPADAPEGLCRACLLKRGLETNTAGYTEEGPAPSRWTPPTVEELAARCPELEITRLVGRGGMGAVYQARSILSMRYSR